MCQIDRSLDFSEVFAVVRSPESDEAGKLQDGGSD